MPDLRVMNADPETVKRALAESARKGGEGLQWERGGTVHRATDALGYEYVLVKIGGRIINIRFGGRNGPHVTDDRGNRGSLKHVKGRLQIFSDARAEDAAHYVLGDEAQQ